MNKTLELASTLINPDYPHVLEFGVWNGTTILQLSCQLPDKKIYGFDSFIGLPEDWSYTTLKKGAFSINGSIPQSVLNVPNIKIISGWFNESIPTYLKDANTVALLHIDCDLYSSTKDILYSDIRNYIKPGTIIVFDEWYYNMVDTEENRQHEQKLFYEWVKDFNIQFSLIPPVEKERQIVKIL